MAALRRSINLLPREEWEKKPIGRLVKWALTFGRYIVIITELIVIIAFISRFKLDSDLSDLYEKIEIKQARVKSLEEFEKEFRLTQKRLKTIRELTERQNNPTKTLSSFAALIPLNITLNELELKGSELIVSGRSLSESGIATLINNLIQSPYFTNIEIGNITKGAEPELNFRLKTSTKI